MCATEPARQLQQLRKAIFQKINQHTISEQQLIQQQILLLQQVKQKLERKKAYESLNSFSLNVTNISSIQYQSNYEDSFRNRFTEQFENSILNSAIKEVKNNCTDETFDTIMNYVVNNKAKQYEEIKKELDKKQKQIEELSVLIIIKQKDINFLERDLQDLRVKEDFLEDERKKVKKKATLLDDKEKRLHNAEMSLIFKEKLNLEGKRRYQRQKDLHDTLLQRLEEVHSKLSVLWQDILSKMQSAHCPCDPNCWKQDVMKRCREQLLQQRKILQQEQQEIEAQYQTMRGLSEQIKKVFINVQSQSTHKKNEENGEK